MDLRDATNYLLRTPDAAVQLELADNYMQAYNKKPSKFILPAAHARLKPIIEAFASDTQAFSHYIRAVRDAHEGIVFDALQQLYRRVNGRAMQRTRRVKQDKALLVWKPYMEAKLGRKIPYSDRRRVEEYIEQAWGKMRLAALAEERALRRTNRLAREDEEIFLESYHKHFDMELDAGRLPLPENGFTHIQRILTK